MAGVDISGVLLLNLDFMHKSPKRMHYLGSIKNISAFNLPIF